MSGPRPSSTAMKRIVSALPRPTAVPIPIPGAAAGAASSSSSPARVRSNSLYTSSSPPLAHSFFDSVPPPPPPTSRPGNPHILSSTKIPVEYHEAPSDSHHSHTNIPHSLALTAPAPTPAHSASTPPLYSQPSPFLLYPSFNPAQYYNAAAALKHAAEPDGPVPRRARPRFHLDVGAYGIPKRCRGTPVAGRDGRTNVLWRDPKQATPSQTELAVQVGEDAYFVRDNAMGVADGVGGWARLAKQPEHSPVRHPTDPSPSGLFARRLMHFCSAEVAAAAPDSASVPSTSATIVSRPMPAKVPSEHEVEQDLEDQFEELEEGLNVLMILERAYESTMRAHVVPAPAPTPAPAQASASQSPNLAASSDVSTPVKPYAEPVDTVPLLTGSSTALLAVLDHCHIPASSSGSSASPAPPASIERGDGPGAVLKIAHVGDCMGMLVRGEEVVWRSEEMWWSFNTPVQLGPTSRSTPLSAAQTCTLPVEADDILILASDGLSDNLWDEDVLEEVVRFRRAFLPPPAEKQKEKETAEKRSRGAFTSAAGSLLARRTLAGMLSEALCSRARRVASSSSPSSAPSPTSALSPSASLRMRRVSSGEAVREDDEVPFARRAREAGRRFEGGKNDDISVIVAVISPA